jgi:hypothetical protein
VKEILFGMKVKHPRKVAWLDRHLEPDEYLRGEPARHTGRYDELNVFGTHTGGTIEAEQGERLPVLPLGFTWRQVLAQAE